MGLFVATKKKKKKLIQSFSCLFLNLFFHFFFFAISTCANHAHPTPSPPHLRFRRPPLPLSLPPLRLRLLLAPSCLFLRGRLYDDILISPSMCVPSNGMSSSPAPSSSFSCTQVEFRSFLNFLSLSHVYHKKRFIFYFWDFLEF